jgi:hypothetical protein
LVERARLEKIVSPAADIAHFEQQVWFQLPLHADAELLNPRCLEIPGDRAELERLRHVPKNGLAGQRIRPVGRSIGAAGDARAVADFIGTGRACRANHSIGQVIVEAQLWILL